MSLITRELRQVWRALGASNVQRDERLTAVRIRELRGIWDIRFPLEYPVSVLAGPNGCGKSTVLFACACAYQVPGGSTRDFTPGRLFPNFTSRQAAVSSDAPQRTELEFHYLHQGDDVAMTWRRRKSWTRSFTSRNRGVLPQAQPQRQVYLRTLANLTNPSELRSVLQLGRKQVETETLIPELLIFAHRILPWRYRNLALISGPTSDLLFAEVEGMGDTRYSEFHMSSGERSILRISKDISRLENALVLIDEIDTGLHPYTQQQAMLELQRSALRQGLQIIVASHSPVVLDSVPPEARIFLDRDDATGQVRRAPLYRDIFQKALYGQSRERLSILCEDEVAEGLLRGVLDVLNVELGLRQEDFVIGRNTGSGEFPGHLRTLGKFDKLSDFIFVLDGDSRALENRLKELGTKYGHRVQPLERFLPGEGSPEQWLWDAVRARTAAYADLLGQAAADLERSMQDDRRSSAWSRERRSASRTRRRRRWAPLPTESEEPCRRSRGSSVMKKPGAAVPVAPQNAIPEFLVALKEQIDELALDESCNDIRPLRGAAAGPTGPPIDLGYSRARSRRVEAVAGEPQRSFASCSRSPCGRRDRERRRESCRRRRSHRCGT